MGQKAKTKPTVGSDAAYCDLAYCPKKGSKEADGAHAREHGGHDEDTNQPCRLPKCEATTKTNTHPIALRTSRNQRQFAPQRAKAQRSFRYSVIPQYQTPLNWRPCKPTRSTARDQDTQYQTCSRSKHLVRGADLSARHHNDAAKSDLIVP
eukprot:2807954-Rhodomonas_salina.1